MVENRDKGLCIENYGIVYLGPKSLKKRANFEKKDINITNRFIYFQPKIQIYSIIL